MEEAILLVIQNEKNENGFPIQRKYEIPVFCKKKSVTHSEFYNAMRADVLVRLILEIRIEEWEESAHIVDGKKEYATKIIYDGGTYDVIRYFEKGKAMVQVTCG